MDLKVFYCRENANISLSTEFAGAYDVTASKIIRDKKFVKVYLGIKTEIPPGWRMRISPRSSITHTSWVMANAPGLVDSDYRGEWIMKLELVTASLQLSLFDKPEFVYDNPLPFDVGERCAQIYAERVEPLNIIEVDNEHHLDPSERGSGGFGSTGSK